MKLLVSIADEAVGAVVPNVVPEVTKIADAKHIPKKSDEQVAKIRKDFGMVIPTTGTTALTDVVNAGWECFHDKDLWARVSQIQQEDRSRVLYDLVLKSLEVAEYSERTGVS
jgi:hypothetical protein